MADDLIWANQIEPADPIWAWYPYLPAGMISLIAGRGGDCKGLICTSLAAKFTTGAAMPDGEPGKRGKVLWCEAEDPMQEVVIPRVIAAEADRELFAIPKRKLVLASLGGMIKKHDIKLVILSPVLSFLQVKNIRDEVEVRASLEVLQRAIAGTDCAVLGICHFNKNVNLDAIERLLGSVAFVNFVRSVILVAREREDKSTVRFMHAKHNLSARGSDLLITTEEVNGRRRSQYVRAHWVKADENADPNSLVGKDPGTKPKAAVWLEELLREMGPTLRSQVISFGKRDGYSEGAIEKAVERMGGRITSEKSGYQGKAVWSLSPT